MKTYLQALAGTNSSSNASLNSTSSPSKTTNSTSNPTTSSDLPVVTPEKVSMTTIESVDKSDDISESGTSESSVQVILMNNTSKKREKNVKNSKKN